MVAAGACALVLAGCGGSSKSSSKSGGTFRMGTSSGIDSINPYVAFNQDAYATFQYIYPILVQYDVTNKHFAPFLAFLTRSAVRSRPCVVISPRAKSNW